MPSRKKRSKLKQDNAQGEGLPASTSFHVEKDQEEVELERAVFGDFEGFRNGLKTNGESWDQEREGQSAEDSDEHDEKPGFEDVQDDELFFLDDGVASNDVEPSDFKTTETDQRVPLWHDSDDERLTISLKNTPRLRKLRIDESDDVINGIEYSKRLRAQYERTFPLPDWAKGAKNNVAAEKRHRAVNSDSDSGSDLSSEIDPQSSTEIETIKDLLQSTDFYSQNTRSSILSPTTINITRLKDANHSHVSKSALQSLSFHPSHPLLATGGFDRSCRIYHVDGKVNPLVTSLHLRSSPIQSIDFHSDGHRVFVSGRRKYFYIWDLESGAVDKISRMYGHQQTQRSMEKLALSPCGRFIGVAGSRGWLNVLSASTGQWIAGTKVDGVIRDFAWGNDGEVVCIANAAGHITEWNVGQRQPYKQWNDEGAVNLTCIKYGGMRDRWCVVGSSTGVVNIYDRSKMGNEESNPKPFRTVGHLVTPIHSLAFSHDGQLLAMSSGLKKDALKLVHLPSGSVYKNWPTASTAIGRVTSLSFSPGSEYLCCGNEAGKARLWKLNHYASDNM